MRIEDAILARIEEMVADIATLKKPDSAAAIGLLVSAKNVIDRVCDSQDSPYREHAAYALHEAVGHGDSFAWASEIGATLKNLAKDARAGLISSVADRARAEVFDDFLDHAQAYTNENRKNEAGAIAGIAFEDSVRRLCRKLAVAEKGVKLDDLISTLTKKGTITAVQAKRGRVAAHVRTKASHAQWDEFSLGDVEATITFTRELITAKLEG